MQCNRLLDVLLLLLLRYSSDICTTDGDPDTEMRFSALLLSNYKLLDPLA